MTYSRVTNATNGNAVVNANGSFTYTPNANFNGSDSFTFKANDGTVDSNTATFNITVNAVNDAPTAQADAATTDEDTPVLIDVLANDDDVDGDTITIDAYDATSANGGTVNCTSTCSYSPAPNFFGIDTFTYDITDGNGGLASATVTITVNAVNDNPVVTLVGPDETEEGTTVSYSFTITDVDNVTFTVDAYDCGANGTVSNALIGATGGSFDCTWDDNFVDEHVSVDVSDDDGGAGSDGILVDVANVDPVVELTGTDATAEGTVTSYSFTITDAARLTPSPWTPTTAAPRHGLERADRRHRWQLRLHLGRQLR